ncbi:MAG TPA: hypothetical protein DDZ80_22315 [Cyanobacteria bacterium UBA8803]|nr:hypothetical protein [Cyanobacteria bacterium UBA9273]HBL61063.1 hypothetical protein [Cyanobacteria bacterium UBA8803]
MKILKMKAISLIDSPMPGIWFTKNLSIIQGDPINSLHTHLINNSGSPLQFFMMNRLVRSPFIIGVPSDIDDLSKYYKSIKLHP